jgi:hypothetical protein
MVVEIQRSPPGRREEQRYRRWLLSMVLNVRMMYMPSVNFGQFFDTQLLMINTYILDILATVSGYFDHFVHCAPPTVLPHNRFESLSSLIQACFVHLELLGLRFRPSEKNSFGIESCSLRPQHNHLNLHTLPRSDSAIVVVGQYSCQPSLTISPDSIKSASSHSSKNMSCQPLRSSGFQ